MSEVLTKPFLEIPLADNRQLSWVSPDDACRWADQELSNWQWVRSNKLETELGAKVGVLRQGLSQLEQARNELRKQPGSEQLKNSFKSAATTLYATHGLPVSSSAAGTFLCNYVKTHNFHRSAAALVALLPSNPKKAEFVDFELACGVADAKLFEAGASDGEESCGQAVDATVERWNQQFISLYEQHSTALSSVSGKYTEQLTKHEQSAEEWERRVTATAQNQEKDFADVKRLFSEHMALAAPVQYWEEKNKRHRKHARMYGIVFLVALGTSAYGVLKLSLWLLGLHDRLLNGFPTTQLAASAQYTFWERLATIGVFFTFVAWLLRVLCRLWLSNLHMSADASERVTMIKTYLSLLERKCASEDSHRTLVLNAIFRPGSTGLIKCDPISHAVLNPMTISANSKGGAE